MRIFTEQTLKEYISKNPKSKVALQEWTTIVKKSKWESFADVKATFQTVEQLKRLWQQSKTRNNMIGQLIK